MSGYKCDLCGREVWVTFRCSCGRQVCRSCINIKEKLCLNCDREGKNGKRNNLG